MINNSIGHILNWQLLFVLCYFCSSLFLFLYLIGRFKRHIIYEVITPYYDFNHLKLYTKNCMRTNTLYKWINFILTVDLNTMCYLAFWSDMIYVCAYYKKLLLHQLGPIYFVINIHRSSSPKQLLQNHRHLLPFGG